MAETISLNISCSQTREMVQLIQFQNVPRQEESDPRMIRSRFTELTNMLSAIWANKLGGHTGKIHNQNKKRLYNNLRTSKGHPQPASSLLPCLHMLTQSPVREENAHSHLAMTTRQCPVITKTSSDGKAESPS